MANSFWDRKRAQLQQEGKLPVPRQPVTSHGAWWQDEQSEHNPALKSYNGLAATPVSQQVPNDNHDYSKATHLKSSAGNCPNCNSGDYVKPSASTAARCWNCGYIDGRQVNDLDTMPITADVKTVSVRQTADGGAQKYRARISTSPAELARAGMELEQSFIGRARVDS